MVSVAIPAYNAEGTILDCLNSIIGQTWVNLEVVVCDDASTDNTCRLIESVKDDRVRLLRNEVNQGEGATRDAAIAACRGRWIALCDADDAWLPGRLETFVKAAAGDERAVVFDDIIMCHDLKNKMVPWKILRGSGFSGYGESPVEVSIDSWIDSRRMLMKSFFSQSLLLLTGARHGDHSFGTDVYFLLKLLREDCVLMYVPTPYYLYRVSPRSASSNRGRYTLFREVLESCIEDFRDRPSVYMALQRKIELMRRFESYRAFLNAVKQRNLGKALLLFLQRPWFLWEFFRHNMNMTLSRLHRLKSIVLPHALK